MKFVKVFTSAANAPTIAAMAETQGVRLLSREDEGAEGEQLLELLVSDEKLQAVMDTLQSMLGTETDEVVAVLPIEAALPRPSDEERREEDKAVATREALFDQAEKSARLDVNYLVLVALSTLVAAIGLLEDNVAVVIGAMVIAPLLGPNLALGLGSALGDRQLIQQALRTGTAGLVLALSISLLLGLILPVEPGSRELMQRTVVGLDAIALALASGAAAALSLTTGLSSVLVGVMVAVALLPPTATVGLMLGAGHEVLAGRAALLLLVNIVSVNLAAKLVFLIRGIRPRTGSERRLARQSTRIYLAVWVVTLVVLGVLVSLIAT
jgi:uncharacterized hydrophobic protein (TIGR00341 family)